MKALPAYQIVHIPLDKEQGLPALDYSQKGNYLVFWWKEIALGHVFLDAGYQLTATEYYTTLVEAIKPAMQTYMHEACQNAACWQHLLSDGKPKEWSDLMDAILAPHYTREIPERVPVSVVICTRNRASYLHKCLNTLQQLTCLPEEIIVVDNAPSDDATKDTAALFKNVVYIREPRPGLSHARNTGLQKATNPIVAFTDDDVNVHHYWVFRVWEAFQNREVAAMAGLVIVSELQTKAQLIFEKHWSFNRGYADRSYNKEYFEATLSEGPPVWKIGAGANMAFRKSVFDEVGLFHEGLGAGASGCSEDSEMWCRILAMGHSIHYTPRAVVFHEHRREIESLKKQIYYYMRGFTAAALLQQRQHRAAGYKKHLFQVLPMYYFRMVKRGFPFYRSKFCTVWPEIRGILSGLVFYHRNLKLFSKLLRK